MQQDRKIENFLFLENDIYQIEIVLPYNQSLEEYMNISDVAKAHSLTNFIPHFIWSK